MKSKNYEYNYSSEEYEISDNRKKELIKKVKDQVRKGFIAHYQVLEIGNNDNEYDFIYDWLDENNIDIRGINGTISGEIPNYYHIPKMRQSIVPDVLEEDEQNDLFNKLSELSDKKDSPEYEKVRNELIERNMKLAKWVTNWKEISRIDLPSEDKAQMAYIGLIDAVDKFKPSLGYKFSTYAAKAIYRRIIKEVVLVDEHLKSNFVFNEQLDMIPEIDNQMRVNLGRAAKPYEIADILGISLKMVNRLQTAIRLKEKDSLDRISKDNLDRDNIYASLDDGDKTIDADSGVIKDGVYVDDNDILPIGFRVMDRTKDKITVSACKDDINILLDTLTPREAKVISMRFGLVNCYNDNPGMSTCTEVGKEFNVTRNRICQIEAKALRKLRHPSRSKMLKNYVRGENFDER